MQQPMKGKGQVQGWSSFVGKLDNECEDELPVAMLTLCNEQYLQLAVSTMMYHGSMAPIVVGRSLCYVLCLWGNTDRIVCFWV